MDPPETPLGRAPPAPTTAQAQTPVGSQGSSPTPQATATITALAQEEEEEGHTPPGTTTTAMAAIAEEEEEQRTPPSQQRPPPGEQAAPKKTPLTREQAMAAGTVGGDSPPALAGQSPSPTPPVGARSAGSRHSD